MSWTNFFIDVLLVAFVVVCPLMCFVILMQRSKQEGLGAAFGGGFTESVWGAQTSNVLVRATVVLAVSFFIISIALARLYAFRASTMTRPSSLQQQLMHPITSSTHAAGAMQVPMQATNSSGTAVVPTETPSGPALVHPGAMPAASSSGPAQKSAPVKGK